MTAVRCRLHGPQMGVEVHKSVEDLILQEVKHLPKEKLVEVVLGEEEVVVSASFGLRSMLVEVGWMPPDNASQELLLSWESLSTHQYWKEVTVVCQKCFEDMLAPVS